MTQENDLLNKFIDNDKKSKRSTLILTIIFVLIAIGVLAMAVVITKQKQVAQNLKLENAYVKHVNDSLMAVLKPKIKEEVKKEYAPTINNYEKQTDSLTKQAEILTDKLSDVKEKIENGTIKAKQASVLTKDINNVITTSVNMMKKSNNYSVYIQYNDKGNNSKSDINDIREVLLDENVNVPQEEYIDRELKNSRVIYFYNEDKEFAEKILEITKRIYSDAVLIKSDINAPNMQIEIWLNSRTNKK